MEIGLYILGGLLVVYVIAQWVRISYYAQIGERLIAEAEALEAHPENPDRSVLIIGDSLWVGVGAADPADSLAGRLIADLPDAQVINKAESGARVSDGMDQLEAAVAEYGDFDQVIIQMGANDIVNFTPLGRSKRDLAALLNRAQEIAPDVAYMISSSVGFAPVFWQPLDWIYTATTRYYMKHLHAVAEDTGTLYIDLFRTREEDPFYDNPNLYYSADLFHPSGAGYGVWYQKCRDELQCFAYDQPAIKEEVV